MKPFPALPLRDMNPSHFSLIQFPWLNFDFCRRKRGIQPIR